MPLSNDPSVTIDAAGILIEHLYETDLEVVELVRAAEDHEAAVRRCLAIGARASQLVQTTVDTEIVGKHFDEMTQTFGDGLDNALRKVNDAASALVGDDGVLVKSLDAWKADVEKCLGDTFDPDSKKSVMAKVENLVGNLLSAQEKAFRDLVDPHAAGSPLKMVKDDLDTAMRREVGEVKAAVVDLAERIAAKKAHEDTMEFTTKKGFVYEDTVHDLSCRITAPFGDSAEKVGKTKGVMGNQNGDEVITLNADDTFGVPERFVLEIKDRKLSLPETYRQLDAAMANREAKVGIAVFSSQDLAPTTVPFHYSGDKAIVVLDKTEPDDRNLRLACTWARWVVRRQLADAVDGLDGERIEAHLADAALALKKLSTIKGCHTAAKKSIDQAGAAAETLAAEVDNAIDGIRAEMVQ